MSLIPVTLEPVTDATAQATNTALGLLAKDTTAQSIVTALSGIKDALEEKYDDDIYGFIEHFDILDPVQRIELTDAATGRTPITVDKANGTFSLGGWSQHPFIKACKPYMVHADGTPDYQLMETDYTKKLDGTASDVANQSYNGGAFAYALKLYKYETISGSDRIVKFSVTPRPGYRPVGFTDTAGNELENQWIPMFYASVVSTKATCISGTQPSASVDTAGQKTAVENLHANAKFFGGAFVETLIDLMYMFAGTTDIQDAWGSGNSSGYVNDSSQYYGVKANAVVGGGMFYGTSTGKALNKIFHSIVLGSYQQWMRDPYEIIANGRVKVSKDYTIDLTGATYSDTGIDVPNIGSWTYPLKYKPVEDYGAVPVRPYSGGSTATGSCDGTYISGSQTSLVAVCLRFGDACYGANAGVRARNWAAAAGGAIWDIGFAVLLSPPAP